MRLRPTLTVVGLLATTGCASLTASRVNPYMVYSTPQGATVAVNGVPIGITPVTVMVEKQRTPQVVLSMPGYAPQACYPRQSPGVGYVVADSLLCLFLFPIGCVSFIDAGGAWNELEVNSCSVYFQAPVGAPYEAPPPPPGYPPPLGPTPPPPPPPPPPL